MLNKEMMQELFEDVYGYKMPYTYKCENGDYFYNEIQTEFINYCRGFKSAIAIYRIKVSPH